MRLFNIFKKKKYSFETLLKKATIEPAYRIAFYKRLLTERLLVITNDNTAPKGSYIATGNTKIKTLTLNDQRIPVFTSTDRIFDHGIIKTQINFAEFNGQVLLKMLINKTLIINPYSDYGKEILPSEIEKILEGTTLSVNLHHLEIKKETRVRIGQPTVYPTALVNSLLKLFTNKPGVKTAYLAFIHDPESDLPPHYIFAIKTTENWDSLSREAAFITQEIMGPEQIVDFLKIENDGGISNYFINESTPFYKKP